MGLKFFCLVFKRQGELFGIPYFSFINEVRDRNSKKTDFFCSCFSCAAAGQEPVHGEVSTHPDGHQEYRDVRFLTAEAEQLPGLEDQRRHAGDAGKNRGKQRGTGVDEDRHDGETRVKCFTETGMVHEHLSGYYVQARILHQATPP